MKGGYFIISLHISNSIIYRLLVTGGGSGSNGFRLTSGGFHTVKGVTLGPESKFMLFHYINQI